MHMTRVRFILVLTAWYLWPISPAAQKFQNVNDQFPMGLSEVIFQDSYGFLWIGTIDGLIRYDGYNAVQYNHDPLDKFSISGNNLNALSEDSNGKIWVGLSVEGANVFDRNSQQFEPICFPDQDGNCIGEISVNYFTQEGELMWIATSQGLFAVEITGSHQMVKRYISNQKDSTSLSNIYVVQVYIDKDNTLWAGTLNGLNQLNRETQRFTNYHTNGSFPQGQILDIDEDPNETLWVSPRSGDFALYTWDEANQIFNAEVDFPRSLGELRITWDHENNMWISSRGYGATRIDGISGERLFFDPIHSDYHGYDNIYGLNNLTDSYGNVWFIGGSLIKWPGSNKSIQSISDNSNIAISVYADDDYIWFCSKEPFVWNKNNFQLEKFWTTEFPTNLRLGSNVQGNFARIYKYDKLDEDHLIIATTRSIYVWNKKNKSFLEYPSDAGGPFRDFAFDRESNALWICPNQGVPVRFDLITRTFERPEALRPIHGAISVELGVHGNIWFGSERWGLYRYNEETNQIVRYTRNNDNPERRISSTKITDLYMDHENNLWIATSKGVNLLKSDSDSIISFNQQDGLPNDHVTSILEDSNGNMWMGTYNGLSMFSKANGTFRHFDQSDGFINANYLARSCFKDKDGMLYFGGDNGVDFFDPLSMGINTIPPDIYLRNITVNNSPVVTGLAPENITSLDFDFEQKIIEIELLALHLTAPLANTYAYRISNISEDWIDLGKRRTITLANPNPGLYNIEVKAANSDGIWSTPKELISITIHPPYWLSWWFILLSILLALGLLRALYQFRTGQIRKEERLKADFEKRIAQLELKALRAQMNPHFLFNSLNSIKSLISVGESEKATEYVTRFSQLIRQVLSNSEQPLVRLEEDLEALRLYLAIERLRFQNFEFEINVDEDVNIDFVEVPPLLLQPYVENAIWHGLMHKTEGDKKINICIKRDRDFLVMQVEDNGIGRDRASHIKMRGGSRKGGMGMRLTRDRIKLLREYYGQDAKVEVEDLGTTVNGVKKASGTKVTVRIPVPE
jgi:Histidine kinase/Y_Y_Y domain/Two component regulator propeller